jgi:hypothetical protein
MIGYTMSEMADILGVPVKTVNMRLFRLGIKPITKDAIYEKSTLKKIKDVPAKGRPRKAAGQEPAKPRASKTRAAKQTAKTKKQTIPRR